MKGESYMNSKKDAIFQTNEDSHFTKKKLISIAKPNGRLTLNNLLMKITRFEIEEKIEFNESEFEEKLKQYFDIEL